MKSKVFIFITLFACLWQTAAAQDQVNMKFGKPTKEEMQMTVYEPEPEADAVVLCRLTDVNYTIQTNGYLVDYLEKIRVKVLKPQGARHANIVIPYYKNEENRAGIKASKMSLLSVTHRMGNAGMSAFDDTAGSMSESVIGSSMEESVEDLKATAFNMVNGKMVKSKLKSTDVVKEKLDDENWQLRFTVPDVKEGTVIEYEYRIHSELFYRLHDWYAQCDIPVVYACLKMDIPKYLMFNMEEHGIQRLTCTCVTGSINYTQLVSDPLAKPITVSTNRYTCIGRDLKGMPKDPYVWSTQDYCAGVTAELKSFSIIGTSQTPYAMTWDQVDQLLLDDPDLGTQQNEHSPLREELTAAKVTDISDLQQRAAAVCQQVMNRVKWNGKYELWPENTRETLKKGEGNNADINMLLIQSLKDAGLNAFPVVLRERDKGLLPANFPSVHKLSTYIVGIALDGSNIAYVDASSAGGWLNVLPEKLLVTKARMLRKERINPWVDLQKTVRSQISTVIDATVDANGMYSGKQTVMYRGLAALHYRQQAGKTGEFAPEATEETTFNLQGNVSNGIISINAFPTAPLSENPFTAEKRLMPVEYPSEQTHQVVVNITLPEGYTLQEVPQTLSASTPDKGVSGRCITTVLGNKVQVMYQLNVQKVLHADSNYDALRGIFDMFSKCSKLQLSIKKS